jgi:ssDNA-binding Zn-finger/Zn-ribbon topoisomerase 1
MESKVCVVCTKQYDTGSILLDTRLRNKLERHNVVGWGLCPEHEKLFNDGYFHLVEINPKLSSGNKASEVYRTGRVASIREIFNLPDEAYEKPVLWVEDGEHSIIDMLQRMEEGIPQVRLECPKCEFTWIEPVDFDAEEAEHPCPKCGTQGVESNVEKGN